MIFMYYQEIYRRIVIYNLSRPKLNNNLLRQQISLLGNEIPETISFF